MVKLNEIVSEFGIDTKDAAKVVVTKAYVLAVEEGYEDALDLLDLELEALKHPNEKCRHDSVLKILQEGRDQLTTDFSVPQNSAC